MCAESVEMGSTVRKTGGMFCRLLCSSCLLHTERLVRTVYRRICAEEPLECVRMRRNGSGGLFCRLIDSLELKRREAANGDNLPNYITCADKEYRACRLYSHLFINTYKNSYFIL